MQERVQKFLSQSGIASRRKAEEFIISGQVFINGKKAKLGDKVDPETDQVKVYGKIVKPSGKKIYLALNKPKNYMVTRKDPQGRKTVYMLLPEKYKNLVWPIGRLDFESEGLLILTNDGELTQELSHPKYEHEKEYEVLCSDSPTKEQLQKLKTGVFIDTGKTNPAKVKAKSNLIKITINEGKNRQIRKMFEAVGLVVKKLTRVRVNKYIMPEALKTGQFLEIKKQEVA